MNGPLPLFSLFLQQFPGNLAYHLVFLFLILAVFFTTFIIGRNSRYLYIREMRTGLLVLLGTQLIMLLGAAVVGVFQLDARAVLPVLDRFIVAASVVWAAWLWTAVQPSKRSFLAAGILSAVLGILWLVTQVLWLPWMEKVEFNAAWMAAAWNGIIALLSCAAAFFLFRTRQFQWYFGFTMFLFMLAGSLLQFTAAGNTGDYPGFIRFGLLAALPLLLFNTQRLFPPPLNEITKEQARLYGDRRRFSAELTTLQDWLLAARPTPPADMHSTIARAAAKTFLADFCFFLPFPGEGQNLIFLCGYDAAHDKELPGQSKPQSAYPTLSAAVRLAEPLMNNPGISPDLELDNLADMAGLRNPASMLYIPLANAETNLGGLLLLTTRKNRAWTREDTAYGGGISQPILELLKSMDQKSSLAKEPASTLQKEYQDLEAAFQQVLLQLSELEQEAEAIQQEVPAGFGIYSEDQAVDQELQLALAEMGHMQDQLTETRQKLASLENPASPGTGSSMLDQEAIAWNTRKILETLDSLEGKADVLVSGAAGELTPVQIKFINQVKNDSEQIKILLEDLKRFVNPLGQDDRLTHFDLSQVVDMAVTETRPDFSAKNCSLHLNADSNVPLIAGDQETFKRILSQLLHNAVAASQPGGIIQLEAALETMEEQQTLLLKVTDSGTGILPDDLEKVFSVPESCEEFQIAGLGDSPSDLQVTYSLVESLGGNITADSADGEGTTFVVSLPVFFAGQDLLNGNNEDQG